MDTAAIILKLNEIERKIEKMQALIDDIKKSQCGSDDTQGLIVEEIHWVITVFRKLFCFV